MELAIYVPMGAMVVEHALTTEQTSVYVFPALQLLIAPSGSALQHVHGLYL